MSNDKVRVALENLDDVSAAYVTRGIILHMASKKAFDKDKISEALKPFKITIKESALIQGSPFTESTIKS